jgi:hypothetical protein
MEKKKKGPRENNVCHQAKAQLAFVLFLAVRGMEPRALHTLSKRSAPELLPQQEIQFLKKADSQITLN